MDFRRGKWISGVGATPAVGEGTRGGERVGGGLVVPLTEKGAKAAVWF